MTQKNPKSFSEPEKNFMNNALALAVRELGNVWPNPAVGCVLEREGEIVGFGWTQPGGRPHAEYMALETAGEKARGATAYVTLEPCAHEDKTPSCARLLAKAGVRRVFYSLPDPDPRTAGKGAEFLKKAGIEVSKGLGQTQALRINQGFFTRQKEKRPMVTLKMAVSKDGKIAEKEGARTRITGREAGLFTHKLRAKYDAILVGFGTVVADDPELTCRITGLEDRSPVRIVLDRDLKISPRSALVKGVKASPLWVLSENPENASKLPRKGLEIVPVNDIKNIKEVLEIIAKKGITRLLVEGGSTTATNFYQSGLVDYIYILKNPALEIGRKGVPAFRKASIYRDGEIEGFELYQSSRLGEDSIDFYRKRN